MPITVTCTGCTKVINDIPDEYAGRKATCQKCGQKILIPGEPLKATAKPSAPLQTPEEKIVVTDNLPVHTTRKLDDFDLPTERKSFSATAFIAVCFQFMSGMVLVFGTLFGLSSLADPMALPDTKIRGIIIASGSFFGGGLSLLSGLAISLLIAIHRNLKKIAHCE